MKHVSRVVCLLLLMVASMMAQTAVNPTDPPNPVSTAVATLTPVVDASALPDRAIFTGAGVHAGQPSGFVNVITRLSGPVYAAFAQDIIAGKTSTRAGIETVIFRRGWLVVATKANAGVATSGTAAGGSYGVGGSVLIDLSKAKLTGYYAVFSGTWDYSNMSEVGQQLAKGQFQPVLSGATWRFGLGKKF